VERKPAGQYAFRVTSLCKMFVSASHIFTRVSMFKHLTIKTRLIFVIAFLAAELIVGAVVGIVNLAIANGEMKNLYDNRIVSLNQLSRIMQLTTSSQMLVAKSVSVTDAEQRSAFMNEVDANVAAVDATWKDYIKTAVTADEQALAAKFLEARKVFLEKGLNPAVAAVRAGDTARTSELVAGDMSRLFQAERVQGRLRSIASNL
jgi:hypothetical protein